MSPPGIEDAYDVEQVVTRQRLACIWPVRQPLAAISQVQRSGGTLLSQLLDGHPQLHVHPSELHIGRPSKYFWPSLDLGASPEDWYEALWEHTALLHAREGFNKATREEYRDELLPFVFLGRLQREIFLKLAGERPPSTQRDVLDAYVTSYFNAWVDYQGLYRDPACVRHWVGFVSRTLVGPKAADAFFDDYPDGKLISLVREPVSWYASARRHKPDEYGDVDRAIELWTRSTRGALRNLYRYGDGRALLVPFERLVREPRAAMARVARFLGVDFVPSLLEPTHNGLPVRANSSFEVSAGGVSSASADRVAAVAPEERARITAATREDYEAFRRSLGPLRTLIRRWRGPTWRDPRQRGP